MGLLPRFSYARGRAAVFVNQFVPSTARVPVADGNVTLTLQTRYPETDTVLLRVEPSRNASFSIHLRIPAWCAHPSVHVNGQAVASVKSGAYTVLNRVWRTGDTVKLTFPMRVQWVEHDYFEDGNTPWALTRGPVVYALDTVWWNDPKAPAPRDAGNEIGLLRDKANLHETAATADALGPFYETDVELATGKKAKATFVPFANIGRWYRPDAPKPELHSRAFSYAVWLRDSTRRKLVKPADTATATTKPN